MLIAALEQIHRIKLKSEEPSSEVSKILCVFNLDKDSIDMLVYVDLARMEVKEL